MSDEAMKQHEGLKIDHKSGSIDGCTWLKMSESELHEVASNASNQSIIKCRILVSLLYTRPPRCCVASICARASRADALNRTLTLNWR